jgi:hypothetical protein
LKLRTGAARRPGLATTGFGDGWVSITLAATVGAAITLAATLGVAASAAADSYTPIRMTTLVTPVARAHAPLKTTVAVAADPGVLDVAEGNLQVEVKLAAECGGSFQTTPGITLVNAPLKPAPRNGQAYSGSVSGSGRPTVFGTQTLCVFLEDSDVGRVFAHDESGQVEVSRPCTTDAARYDREQTALKRAQRQLVRARGKVRRRRVQRTIAQRRRTATRFRRAARKACGPGVTL